MICRSFARILGVIVGDNVFHVDLGVPDGSGQLEHNKRKRGALEEREEENNEWKEKEESQGNGRVGERFKWS